MVPATFSAPVPAFYRSGQRDLVMRNDDLDLRRLHPQLGGGVIRGSSRFLFIVARRRSEPRQTDCRFADEGGDF
jgi:hypothetical protein